MLSIKQYELLLRKITIQEGGCKVFTVLCSLGKLADSPLSVSSGYDEGKYGFQFRSPGKFSYGQ